MNTKTKRKPKNKSAFYELLQRMNDGKRFPRKLRRAVMQEMGKEEKKFKDQVKEYYTKVIQAPQGKNPFQESFKVPKFKSRLVTLFDEKFRPSKNFQFPDLFGKGTSPGVLTKVIWPEKGFPQTSEQIEKKEFTEVDRSVTLKPEEVQGYMKKAQETWKPLRESGLNDEIGFQGQFDVSRTDGFGKYFPYPPNSFTRQMYAPDSWFMLARCAHVYNYNPMAKAGMDIKTSFIIGNGPRVIIKTTDQSKLQTNQKLSKLWKDFEREEDFVESLRTWTTMLNVNGELFTEFFKSIITNKETVRSIDPGHVYEIITEPRDIRAVYGYKLMYQTANQIFTQGANGEQVANSEWIYETVPPDNIMHMKINIQENEKRGRSDLLCVLPVCQLFEDYINYKVLQEIVKAAFVWDVEFIGGDQAQIDAFLADEEQAFPRPASTRAHNENTKWTPQGIGTSGSSEDGIFEMLLTIFAVGVGIPREYMGAGRGGTRANSITSTEPSVKNFESRRHKLEGLILRIIDFLATSNGIEYDPADIEIAWPAIAPEDIGKMVDILYTALDRDTFTKQRVDEIIAKFMDQGNYDWTKEMTDRLKEKMGPGLVKSLADGSAPMLGIGMETPDAAKPAVQPQPPAGSPTAASNTQMSGAPSSISSEDRSAIKDQGQHL